MGFFQQQQQQFHPNNNNNNNSSASAPEIPTLMSAPVELHMDMITSPPGGGRADRDDHLTSPPGDWLRFLAPLHLCQWAVPYVGIIATINSQKKERFLGQKHDSMDWIGKILWLLVKDKNQNRFLFPKNQIFCIEVTCFRAVLPTTKRWGTWTSRNGLAQCSKAFQAANDSKWEPDAFCNVK